jgi:dTDP-4-amino-4,6-dideoxygalactose transaminase
MIPFAPPRIDQKIIDEVVDTLKSGWITTGPKTKLFEKKIAAYTGASHCVALNSATAGLELMLRWFGVGPGDEVILPAYTYSATANVVVHCGAKPVLVDIEYNDFNISVEKIKEAITPATKVIMPVDFAGLPCQYNQINEVVNKFASVFVPKTEIQKMLGKILVLSDSAHSFGATYNNHKTGTLVPCSVFSFHAVKNLTTAEGGAIALNFPEPFNNEEIYKSLCITSLHGQNKDALAKMQKGNWQYDIIEAGYKCNMTDIAASIGLVELERYENDTLQKRKSICEFYQTFFSKFDWAQLPILKDKERESSYHLFALRIKNCSEGRRNKIIQEIFENNVSVNVHFIPLPLLSFYKNLGYSINNYPVSYNTFSQVITLPVFYNLSQEQLNTIAQTVAICVEKTL